MVLIAAGDAPDIFSVDDQRLEFLESQGVLMELGKSPEGEPIYSVHPGSLNKLVIWETLLIRRLPEKCWISS